MTQTIDWDRAVLLPVDMQQAFDGPEWPQRWNRNVDANGLALLLFGILPQPLMGLCAVALVQSQYY